MTGWPIDDGVVDPFVVLKSHPALEGVPMPREALRDRESLRVWPSTDLAGVSVPQGSGPGGPGGRRP